MSLEPTNIELSHDGSHTMYSDKYNAHYHSIYGAVDESVHVFLSAGFYHKQRQGVKDISIFEMGLGTGLNAYLTLLESQKSQTNVNYITVETDPLLKEKAQQLNYSSQISPENQELFDIIHDSPWSSSNQLTDNFILEKHHISIQEFSFEHPIDIIYYDAFAPSCQPELWEEDIHKRLYKALKPNGILVTYCAKGSFKRMLKSLGYKLEMLNGPNKKREMTRAVKV